MYRLLLAAAAILLAASATGCGQKLEVKSDTSWTGAIGGTKGKGIESVTGSGDRTFNGYDCGTFQKSGRIGCLSAKVVYCGLFARTGQSGRTCAEYGVVTVCGD